MERKFCHCMGGAPQEGWLTVYYFQVTSHCWSRFHSFMSQNPSLLVRREMIFLFAPLLILSSSFLCTCNYFSPTLVSSLYNNGALLSIFWDSWWDWCLCVICCMCFLFIFLDSFFSLLRVAGAIWLFCIIIGQRIGSANGGACFGECGWLLFFFVFFFLVVELTKMESL